MTTARAMAHPAYAMVAEELGDASRVVTQPDVPHPQSTSPLRLAAWQIRQHRAWRHTFATLRSSWIPDSVFVVTLDYIDKIARLLGSPFAEVPFGGILLRPTHHHGKLGLRRARAMDVPAAVLFDALLRLEQLRFVLTIDEPLAEENARRPEPRYRKVRFLPDAARSAAEPVVTKERLARRQAILVYGSLSMRKGIAQLFRAVEHPATPHDIVVCLAGEPDDAVRAFLGTTDAERLRRAGRLEERLHFHDDAAESAVLQEAYAVWLGYSGFTGMSGVMLLAGAYRKPVIACREGLIGWHATRYQTGPVVEPDDTPAVATTLARLATDLQARSEYAAHGWVLSQRHSATAFATRVCDHIVGSIP